MNDENSMTPDTANRDIRPTVQRVTAKMTAATVADRWRKQYQEHNGTSNLEIWEAIKKAGLDTEQIEKVIGNKSWTTVYCDTCDEQVYDAVLFVRDSFGRQRGEELLYLCLECVKAASQVAGSGGSQWQPIETAEKDGAEILAYRQGPNSILRAPYICMWSCDNQRWESLNGCEVHPTGWQPLPEVPSE